MGRNLLMSAVAVGTTATMVVLLSVSAARDAENGRRQGRNRNSG